ncbi:probable methyltransferase TARBP1 isoform X2 [Ischnura elegans]|uniref:probable methyltransferase TARBP1 isoform X2 n=1 Tax=Ischnura elegans TaxID=197161 RepID=UPI001ED88A23|nr:probable methyltransferase TARBP1 isoform X2 [Ischnura elegans]
MTETLRDRLAVDIKYANQYVKLYNVDEHHLSGKIKEQIDILLVLDDSHGTSRLIPSSRRMESLKLLLLSKLELSQDVVLKSNLIPANIFKLISDVCLRNCDSSESSEHCDIVEISLWLLSENDFLESVVSLLKICQECLENFLKFGKCLYKGSDLPAFHILNLIESILIVIVEKHSAGTLTSSSVDHILIDPLKFCNIFVELVFDVDKIISSLSLLKIVPLLSTSPFKLPVIENLWSRIKGDWRGVRWEESSSHKLFYVLCSLSNHFLPKESGSGEKGSVMIVNDNTFWEIILSGIGQNDSLIRKQSRFLLKKALDVIFTQGCHCNDASSIELLNWHSNLSKDILKLWSDYFLVLEALEEKQTHVIEPVLNNYENSTSSKFSASISAAWNLPVYLAMFNHDSNAIVRWGFRLFLSQNLELYRLPSVNIANFIHHPFLEALNNNSLYQKTDDGFDVEISLQKLFLSLGSMPKEISNIFYSLILSRLCSINWGPVSLFYVMKSLSSVTSDDKPWDASSFATIKLFLKNTIHTHSPLIRGAVQSCLLKMMVSLFDPTNASLPYLADIFGVFCCNEAFKRGSESWELVVNWLKTFVMEEEASNFISHSQSLFIDPSAAKKSEIIVSTKAFARMCLLLFDASFFLAGEVTDQAKAFCHVMNPLFMYIVRIHCRPFVPISVIDCNVLVICNFVEECSSMSSSNDVTRNTILKVTCNLLEDITSCYRRRLASVEYVSDYDAIISYMKGLYTLSNEEELLSHLLRCSEGLVEDAFLILESREDLTMAKYFSMNIISWMASLLLKEVSFSDRYFMHCKTKVSTYMKNYICSEFMSKTFNVVAPDGSDFSQSHHLLRALIKSDYLLLHWKVLHSLLEAHVFVKEEVISWRKADLLLSDAIESVETGGREILSPVMSVFQILMPLAIKESFNLAWDFCALCWKNVFEYKKSDYFWVVIEKFIAMTFQEEIMLMTKCERHILKYAHDLYSHGQTIGRIYQLFISHLSNTISSPTLWKAYYTILVDGLVFGPLLRKDQRIYKDTCEYILSYGAKYCLNPSLTCEFSFSTSVRVKSVALLINIVKMELQNLISKSSSPKIAGEVTNHLWQNILKTTKENSRYYGNSHVHRLKQRAMQSLLLLELCLNEEQCQHLMNLLCDSLQIESHQPSVKYFQEWLLVRILAHHPKLRQTMWDEFQKAGVKRPGCMSSFISVIFHLSRALPHEELEKFIGKGIEFIHPWCMAQQFIVRLFAQVVLQKLWETILTKNFEKLLSRFKVVFDSVNSSLNQGGNTQRNLLKLKESFYFEIFHPMDHFSLETIFYDIPRLGNVSNDEWIPTSEFECLELHSVIQLKNESEALRQSNAGDWAVKSAACKIESMPTDGDETLNIQKKIMPWKIDDLEEASLFPEAVERGKQLGRRSRKSGGLVVVASLVDRMPNLGGLCRTCEAFGVSEFVLGSLKYTEDPQFQNLSVSAERWISISEVKPYMLGSYLASMKEKGFSLVGAEQTSGSIKLDTFQFPEKTLLVLGNEKGGIPADILPLMDVCVEVPQEGLIRSLNVHVTGAIFIWEYVRQNNTR